jgi:glycosyltransferase involved in cell wall biosynthesis
MKILIAHNAYQHRGGEDTVVDAEAALLRDHGHTVEIYGQHSDALTTMSPATAAMTAIWSTRSATDITDLCKHFRPDVIHAHNTFPLISPSLYWSAARRHVPVVQTLHNFRLLCPQAMFLRDGKICEDCIGKLPWRAIIHKCYRASTAQSAVLTCMLAAHRSIGTYQERVTRYVVLNRFARDKYVEGGLPAQRMRIKPNFVAAEPLPESTQSTPRRGGLYVGRLSPEKGIGVLSDAVRLLEQRDIAVIGGGPVEAEAQARQCFGSDYYLGFLPLDDIMQRMRASQFLVLPSICYENSPRTIVEAYASGLPVIASRLGPLVDIVHDGVTGLLFTPGDALDLAAKIRWAQSHPEQMMAMGRAARTEYEAQYTPERNYSLLMEIYEDAISTTKHERDVA